MIAHIYEHYDIPEFNMDIDDAYEYVAKNLYRENHIPVEVIIYDMGYIFGYSMENLDKIVRYYTDYPDTETMWFELGGYND